METEEARQGIVAGQKAFRGQQVSAKSASVALHREAGRPLGACGAPWSRPPRRSRDETRCQLSHHSTAASGSPSIPCLKQSCATPLPGWMPGPLNGSSSICPTAPQRLAAYVPWDSAARCARSAITQRHGPSHRASRHGHGQCAPVSSWCTQPCADAIPITSPTVLDREFTGAVACLEWPIQTPCTPQRGRAGNSRATRSHGHQAQDQQTPNRSCRHNTQPPSPSTGSWNFGRCTSRRKVMSSAGGVA